MSGTTIHFVCLTIGIDLESDVVGDTPQEVQTHAIGVVRGDDLKPLLTVSVLFSLSHNCSTGQHLGDHLVVEGLLSSQHLQESPDGRMAAGHVGQETTMPPL